MIPSVGSPATTPSFSTGGVALQGQLARYEKELSACVNCATAETTEGKQKIQEVSSQIEQIKARIEQATQTRSRLRVEENSPVGLSGGVTITETKSAVAADSKAQPKSRIGSLIDVIV